MILLDWEFLLNLILRTNMGAYDFVVALHERGGEVVSQHVCRGGTHIEYREPNNDEVKVKFCNRA